MLVEIEITNGAETEDRKEMIIEAIKDALIELYPEKTLGAKVTDITPSYFQDA